MRFFTALGKKKGLYYVFPLTIRIAEVFEVECVPVGVGRAAPKLRGKKRRLPVLSIWSVIDAGMGKLPLFAERTTWRILFALLLEIPVTYRHSGFWLSRCKNS